jgi:hypothetical protein
MKAGMRLYLWDANVLHQRWIDISLEEYDELEKQFCNKEDYVRPE